MASSCAILLGRLENVYRVDCVFGSFECVFVFMCGGNLKRDKAIQRYLTDTLARNSSYCIFINRARVSVGYSLPCLVLPLSARACGVMTRLLVRLSDDL